VPDDTPSGGGCKGKELQEFRIAKWEIAEQALERKQKTENRKQDSE
jgi:hypothetical protein